MAAAVVSFKERRKRENVPTLAHLFLCGVDRVVKY